MPQVSGPLNLDVGLEQVSFHHEPEVSTGAAPFGELVAHPNPRCHLRLEEVLYAPASHEQQLLTALRPQVHHRDVMQPHIFCRMTEEVLDRLRRRSRNTSTQEDRRRIRKAAGTLDEFVSLMSLLRQNQHALRRG